MSIPFVALRDTSEPEKPAVLADTTTTCPTSPSAITVTYQSPTMLDLTMNTSTLTGVVAVEFILIENGTNAEVVLGRGMSVSGSPQLWRMTWDTRYYKFLPAAVPATYKARIRFSSNNSCITSPSVTYSIPANATTTVQQLQAAINPPSWTSLVNTSRGYTVDYLNLPSTLHPFVLVNWQPDIGYIDQPTSKTTNYFTGPTAGTGKVKALITYSGQTLQPESTVQVYTPTTTTNTSGGSSAGSTSSTSPPTTTPTEDSSGTTNESTDSIPEPLPIIPEDADLEETLQLLAPQTVEPTALQAPSQAIAVVLNANQDFKACVSGKLGEDTLTTILRENRRPRSDEFVRFVPCFEPKKNIIPSILAPVEPTRIPELEVSNDIRLASLKNDIKVREEDGSEADVLVIRGTTTPNKTVLLYVFSEPLVFVTTADSEGNWTYTLEDPLEPGKHEVYATVDRGDGEYQRSEVASFVIGSAQATDGNPNGYSLKLVEEELSVAPSNDSVNVYIAVAIGLVTFTGVLVSGLVLTRYKFRGTPSAAITDSDESKRPPFIQP